jgi:hypothetical protein
VKITAKFVKSYDIHIEETESLGSVVAKIMQGLSASDGEDEYGCYSFCESGITLSSANVVVEDGE